MHWKRWRPTAGCPPTPRITFDDLLVRKVVETVRVESTEKLEITFKDGNRRVVELPGRK